MDTWHIWVILALILVIVEIFTSGFVVICFAVGAAAAAVASCLSSGIQGQILWFSVATFLAFIAVRPLLLRSFNKGKSGRKSGIEALEGREAIVTERISYMENSGRVAIDGDDWKAVADDKNEIIEKGQKVFVTGVDSVILKVRKKQHS